MAAFHEVRLPDDIERGAIGGPEFNTGVIINKGGFEQRSILWTEQLSSWDIGYGISGIDDLHTIRDFWYVRRGRANGFRFKDWLDFEILTVQTIAIADGIKTQFQAIKTYSSGSFTYDRPLYKLVAGKTVVYLDAVIQVSGFTINDNTGVITFTSAPGNTVLVRITTEFDVPVRFSDDKFNAVIETFQAGAIPQIPITEIKQVSTL